MSRKEPGRYVKVISGYSDCWYCCETVVDALAFTVETREGPLTIPVCRKRSCREKADSGEPC